MTMLTQVNGFLVVPDMLADAINAKLDNALQAFPDISADDRDVLYRQLLSYFNEHGVIPDFGVTHNA